MIKQLAFKNFYCFKEGATIDFSFDGNVPEKIKDGRDFTTVIGIKGANGSGKTNIIKAFNFLNDFCTRSMKTKESDPIPLDSFNNNDSPTDFFVEFELFEQSYTYELSLNQHKIFSEVICKTTNRKITLIERVNNDVINSSDEYAELKNIKLKSNASIISTALSFKFSSTIRDLIIIETFFSQILTNVYRHGYHDYSMPIKDISKEYLEQNKKGGLFDFVKNIIKMADSGIRDITIESRLDEEGKTIYFPLFTHENCGETFTIRLHEESSGTKRLYEKMYLYWLALQSGGVLALDEFDIHLHSLILPKVIELFLNKESNPRNAQFIFTAHNTEILETLGKYRTVLVNKVDNESYCYRLDDIPGTIIRNDRPIAPLYLKGKIGGVPDNVEV